MPCSDITHTVRSWYFETYFSMTQTGMDKKDSSDSAVTCGALEKAKFCLGWSGGEMGLVKLPVPGRSTNLD